MAARSWRLGLLLWGSAACAFFSCVTHAREFEVRLLNGTEQNGTWGTKEFQVNVSSLGVVRHVKVCDKEVIWQAVALYTSPVPPGGAEGVRTVQGEGMGERGLSVEPPRMVTRDENGSRIFEYEILVANKKVLDGKPLCKILQKLRITPNGEIHVFYDCEWLQTLRWDGFGLLMIFNEEQCNGRDYLVMTSDQIKAGKLDPGPAAERQIRSLRITQLTVRPEMGSCHFVWDAEAQCSFYWGGKQAQLHVDPPCVPYRGSIYQGQRDKLAFRILLPVSQQ